MDRNKNNNENVIIDLKMLLKREIAKLEKQIIDYTEQQHITHNSLWLQQIADSIIVSSKDIIPFSGFCEIKNIHTGITEKITLNPKLNPEKNASLYLKKAKKASINESLKQNSICTLSEKLKKLKKSLTQVTSFKDEKGCTDITTIIDDVNKIISNGITNTDNKAKEIETINHTSKSIPPFRHYKIDEWDIYIGKSDEQNDELSINFTNPDDLWFHVAGYAGAHVIIRRLKGSPEPGKNVIEAACAIAAWFSKARNVPTVEVHYCEGRFIHKRKNAPRGEVIVEKYRSIKIKPESPDILFKHR